jgi:DNA-binding NarL/FixJ family response regulator
MPWELSYSPHERSRSWPSWLVVALVAEGLSNREVAHELSLSEHTIKKYLFRIFDKLGISSRVELVLYAVSHGGSRQAEWIAGAGA